MKEKKLTGGVRSEYHHRMVREMEEIIYLKHPTLHKPYMVVGFEGWPNAAEVSSFAVRHLVEVLDAKRFASVPTEHFYQLSTSRPVATVKGGRLLDLKFPDNHFYHCRPSRANDLILFHGVEPHFHWSAFVDLVLDLAEKFDVSRIFTLGGTYDYIPHTCPPLVSAVFNHEDLMEQVIQAGLTLTEYSGPISIHTFILEGARKRGIRAISLWGHAPQYLQTKNVKVACSVLRRLVNLTGIEIDLSELERTGDYFDQQIKQVVERDPELREVIGKLEEAYKKTESSSQLSKEEKVVYIQAFLKRQDDEEKKD